MRMYVYSNHIRLRAHWDELSVETVNKLTRILSDYLFVIPQDVQVKSALLKSGRLIVDWNVNSRELAIEAADIILDYFEQERCDSVYVRFCLPDCGSELWSGEWMRLSILEPDRTTPEDCPKA